MEIQHKLIQMTQLQIKNGNNQSFTCYGNVKGNIDHALDRTLDGAYQASIDKHKANGTAPMMFWNHDRSELPIGKWINFEEDETGLLLEGQMSQTQQGKDIFTLMKEGALNSFSIGYRVIQEKWNHHAGCNDLIELDIREVSVVNFPCNELSTLQSIQKSLKRGEILSKAELRQLLKFSQLGLSKRQIENITARYDATPSANNTKSLLGMLENSSMFQ